MANFIDVNNNNHNKDNNRDNNSKDNNRSKILEEKVYIWIDKEIENEENKYHYNVLFKQKNIDCKKFNNIEDGFDFLNNEENNFKEIVIIISGRLFNEFYYKIKNNLDLIKCSPTIIVFTRKSDLFINQLKMNNIYYNNDIFDTKLIFTRSIQLEGFIDNINREGKELTFEKIENIDQLIIPTYYSYLLEDVNRSEIDYFNNFIEKKFLPPTEEETQQLNKEEKNENKLKKGNEDIQKLVNQIKNKKMPKEIIIKYWLRIYSSNSEFYKELNKSLRNKDNQAYFYHPFIKLCYEGIRKGFLKSYNKKIYRGSNITKSEFNDIQKYFNSNNKKSNYPNIILYSRSFLSFSEKEIIARKFIKQSKQTYSILYIIEEIENNKNFDNKIFNSNIADFSDFIEKEILVFPFTVFEIVDIKEIKQDIINYQINLKYLGNYSNYLEEELGKNYLDKISFSKFSEELIESEIVKKCNVFSMWIKKKSLEIKLDIICFFLEGEKDCVSFLYNIVYVFNIQSYKIKHKIDDYKGQILDIIKLKSNRICVFYKDGFLKIIEFNKNNEIMKQNNLKIYESNLTQVVFLENENFLCVDNKNDIKFFYLEQNAYNYDKNIKEKNQILKMNVLPDDKIIYITEDKNKNKFINFIDLKKREKDENFIKIKNEKEKLQIIDLIIVQNYILICYNCRIDILNYLEKTFNIQSLEFFDYEITNIIELTSDRIIIGLYDPEQNQSFIREHLFRVDNFKKNLGKFDCIGQGKLKFSKIENILKINESQILINTKDNCIIYKRKNEVSELLKESLLSDIYENVIIKEAEEEVKDGNENKNAKESIKTQTNINGFKKAVSSNIIFPNPLKEGLKSEFVKQKSKPIINNYPKFNNNQLINDKIIFNKNPIYGNNNLNVKNKIEKLLPEANKEKLKVSNNEKKSYSKYNYINNWHISA